METVDELGKRRASLAPSRVVEATHAAMLEAQSVSAHLAIPSAKRFIRLNQVEALTGLRKSHIYGLMRTGGFPQRVVLSRRCVAFVESEVVAWLDARVAERDAS